ncbi:MAG: tRNA (guanosine(46)-N7)-methyltransferase TrmB [Sulfurospirillum sp.]
MPNFKTNGVAMPNFPVKFGDSEFLYQAICKKDESLIRVKQKNEDFFIQIRKKDGGYLIKADKISRPSQVVFVQQALRDFRDLIGCKVEYSNIDPQKIKPKTKFRALKDINFFANEFIVTKEIWLEVGFGSGRHLLHQAKKHEDIQFIGLEIHKPSLEQVAKQCELQSIKNIYLLDYDARIFLEFLESNSVGKIFVHFPVPWDKKPHRRVISSEFISESIRVLKEQGRLELRTDSQKYFDYSLEEFLKLNILNLCIKKNRDLDISSKYEDRWKRQEKDIFDLTMINEEISEVNQKIEMIRFEKRCDFAKLKKGFEKIVKSKKECFLHVEDIYEIDENEGLLKISFGASAKNERVYVEFLKDRISYFPDNILATKANQLAHSLLDEWLEEISG